jgi:hypothetical protein
VETNTLVASLRARGVFFGAREDGGVSIWPRLLLTEEEATFLRDHAAELRSLLVGEPLPPVKSEPPSTPAPPRPEPMAMAKPDAPPDRAALDRWRVEVRYGKPPRPLPPPTGTATMLELIRRYADDEYPRAFRRGD